MYKQFRMCLEAQRTHPKSQNTKKHHVYATFRQVRTNFCLLPCDVGQEPNGNCSEKTCSDELFLLQVDFPPLSVCANCAFIWVSAFIGLVSPS